MGKLFDEINKIETRFYERLEEEIESSHFVEIMFDEIAKAFARIDIAVIKAEDDLEEVEK